MKNKTHVSKLFAAFMAGVFLMAFAGSSIAAIGDEVTPNFTNLKLGEPTHEPGTGSLTVESNVYAEGRITSEGLLVGAALITSRVIPSAGTLNVIGDLNVDGSVLGEEIGYYYIVSNVGSGDSGCSTCFNHAYCESDDIVVGCEGVALQGADGTMYDSITYAGGDYYCTTATTSGASMLTQAICLSPDGEPSDEASLSTYNVAELGSFVLSSGNLSSVNVADIVENEVADIDFATMFDPTDFSAEMEIMFEDYINTYVESTDFTSLMQTNLDSWGYATESFVNTKFTSTTKF